MVVVLFRFLFNRFKYARKKFYNFFHLQNLSEIFDIAFAYVWKILKYRVLSVDYVRFFRINFDFYFWKGDFIKVTKYI